MKHELLFSGIGGQGIMLLGELLCKSIIQEGYNASFAPFYGQEKRGGRTMCNVVVSDSMESPIISEAELMLVMDERSLKDFESLVAPQGTLLINGSMIEMEPSRSDITVKRLPFYEVASKIGDSKVSNLVALGAALKYLPFIRYDSVEKEIKETFKTKPQLIDINVRALKAGYEL